MLFSDISRLADSYPECKKKVDELQNVLAKFHDNPELINSSPETAPSKRIIKALEDKYHYNKPKSGTEVTRAIGIDTLLSKCRHFSEWVKQLQRIGSQ